MAAYTKKIITLLVVVASVSGIMLAYPTQSAGAELAKPSHGNTSFLFTNDPNLSIGSKDSLNTKELFFKMMLAVLFVIALGVAAIYVSKKFLPKISNLPGKKIRVVETLHLGSRKAMHLVKIGDQQFLIGSTTESITKLADITDGHLQLEKPVTNNQ